MAKKVWEKYNFKKVHQIYLFKRLLNVHIYVNETTRLVILLCLVSLILHVVVSQTMHISTNF